MKLSRQPDQNTVRRAAFDQLACSTNRININNHPLSPKLNSSKNIDRLESSDESPASHHAEEKDLMSDSESEDIIDACRHHDVSDKRKAENNIFTNYISERRITVMKDEAEAVAEATNDEELTIHALMSNQESHVIINDPREYQLELFERAKEQNTIAVLDTGSGKTLIAVLLLKHILDQELEDRARGKGPRTAFFLVDSVTLVFQQFAVLECNLDQRIDRFCGEMGCDLWSKETWEKVFEESKVIVCTADILYQCLMHSFISMEAINLLVFDEAHHAKKNHPYARIIKDYYIPLGLAKRPKIFGMTASPLDARQDPIRAAKELEAMLHSQIATASNLSLLQMVTSRPQEECGVYDRLEHPYDTEVSKLMHRNYGKVPEFQRILSKAREAASELGEWCANQLWVFALSDEEARKLEQQTERQANNENRPIQSLDAQIKLIRDAKDDISRLLPRKLMLEKNCISPKVLLLHHYLAETYEKPTDTKCIIFVTRRYTARVLCEILREIGTTHLRLGLLIGTKSGELGEANVSVKQQILTLAKFRKGELNCLVATSIAEEGLDIPDCNLIIRFDLYRTMIQYVQSRGRARHKSSKYLHMVEKHNRAHRHNVTYVRDSESKMRAFCEALPQDRLLKGNEYNVDSALVTEPSHRKYVDPETGATLTYNSSLVVLAHFIVCLPHHPDKLPQALYHMSAENKKFQCEVILPDNSPLHSAIGRPAARKSIAKRSAAFEACCLLRQMGHLDKHLLPTYHKLLPQMRNAHLAIQSKKTNTYDMKLKPSVWEQSRGISPKRLFVTILELEHPENLSRPCEPLALLTRTMLPSLPSFLLHVQPGKTSHVVGTSLPNGFTIDRSALADITEVTLRIYKDIFNKTFEFNESAMSYWIVPVCSGWKTKADQSPGHIIDWPLVKYISRTPEIPWTSDTPPEQLIGRFLVDRWDGGRRWFSLAVEPKLKPTDPVPSDVTRSTKNMSNILDYTVKLFSKSRTRAMWHENQPVIRAEQLSNRLNWLEEYDVKEQRFKSTSYICPEPLKFSALPIGMVSMAYMFPAIITRLESYLIALEACRVFNLNCRPELALEAVTKDSDHTEEHRIEQIHLQRGMGRNYERLEFIGDCFLKMATSISLFAQSPDNNEFEYHVKRMVMICNKNLLKTATKRNLYQYIRSMGFSRRSWYPQGIKLLEGKGHNRTGNEVFKHHLGDKTIADVCEALIGAALLSYKKEGNMDMAVRAVTALVASSDHNVDKWVDYYPLYEKPNYQIAPATASQIDLVQQIEQSLGYKFKYPRLLRSAFIHPSYPYAAEMIPCYQRLEFLGDSLLDMASVNFLFHGYPDKDPQWLTEHKMAMVSNKFLAAVSVKLGFHKHLRSNGAVIEAQNREYVVEINEAEAEANGAQDYWTNTKQPPKALSDIVESYIGAVFVDSEFNYHEVEKFFDRHVRPFFEDMSIYDTFANNHPTTYLHNLLSLSFGCSNYRLMASELPSCIPGAPSRAIAVVMIHSQIMAEGQSSSGKNAKVKASKNALRALQGLAPFEYRLQYRCDCENAAQGQEEKRKWVGRESAGVVLAGNAV